MSKKIILWLILGALVGIMLFALIYGLFDVHDTKPFPVDPESAILIASALLTLSFRVLLIQFPLIGSLMLLAAWVCPLIAREISSLERAKPEPFISPPPIATSLRI